MPPQSVYGNKLACVLMRILFRVHYTDLGPFRAIDYAELRALGMTDENFGWTIEMQIKAARRGLRIDPIDAADLGTHLGSDDCVRQVRAG